MSNDRRRPLQQNPIIELAERLELRLVPAVESKPAIKPDTARLAAQAVELLRNGGFECALLEPRDDDTARTLH